MVDRLATALPDYRRIVLCSPFIDVNLGEALVSQANRARQGSCCLQIVTTPQCARHLRTLDNGHGHLAIVPVQALHAKVYLTIGRRPELTRLLVSSANLTLSGLRRNIELGILASCTSDAGRRLISETTAFIDRLIAHSRIRHPGGQPGRAA